MTKLEEVARAMFEAFQDGQDKHLRRLTWDEAADWRPFQMAAAIAAVKALREPSLAMMVAGDQRSTAVKAWISMIDAILNEKA